MMNIKTFTIALVFVVLVLSFGVVLSGCSSNPTESKVVKEAPSMFVTVESAGAWHVVYHRETKVMYAVSDGYYNKGTFTLLVNPDGTPMLYEGERMMAEYIDNGVMAVGCRGGLGIIHTDEGHDICTGVVFKKSGMYKVHVDGNLIFVDYVAPDNSTCVGCRYNTRPGRDELPDVMCMSCSRRCTDHYEKEESKDACNGTE